MWLHMAMLLSLMLLHDPEPVGSQPGISTDRRHRYEASCPTHGAPIPVPIDPPSGAPMGSMWVVRSDTPNPFWIAVPNQDAEPGYLSNSARATSIMNPSGSLLVDTLLAGENGCSHLNAEGLPPLVVDVGAHIGWFTLLAASYGCRVIAFEPQPHAHMFLNASIALNGFQDRVTLVRAAVSDVEGGTVKIVNPSGWHNWDITEVATLGDAREGLNVDAVLVDKHVDEDVILFKIDAEGEEDAVLRSSKRLLETRSVEAFLVESKATGDAGSDSFKREWFQSALDVGYSAYEFYEEVGRSVWRWDLDKHIFPVQRVKSFAMWPSDQSFEDHLIVKGDAFLLLESPSVSIEFPPDGHIFGMGKVGITTASRGLPEGHSVVLQVNSVVAGVADSQAGVVIGRQTSYVNWMVSDLAPGTYTTKVYVVGSEGAHTNIEGSELSFSVGVQSGGEGKMHDKLKWHCERFFGREFCV